MMFKKIVTKSKIKDGIACIFVPGSTGSVETAKYEPGLKKDLTGILQKIAPKREHYDYHETWFDGKGH